jgi:hypothetical protein
VLTARYGLSSYIKQTRLVFKGLLPCKTLTDWSRITEVESVHSAVRTEFLYKTDTFSI